MDEKKDVLVVFSWSPPHLTLKFNS